MRVITILRSRQGSATVINFSRFLAALTIFWRAEELARVVTARSAASRCTSPFQPARAELTGEVAAHLSALAMRHANAHERIAKARARLWRQRGRGVDRS